VLLERSSKVFNFPLKAKSSITIPFLNYASLILFFSIVEKVRTGEFFAAKIVSPYKILSLNCYEAFLIHHTSVGKSS